MTSYILRQYYKNNHKISSIYFILINRRINITNIISGRTINYYKIKIRNLEAELVSAHNCKSLNSNLTLNIRNIDHLKPEVGTFKTYNCTE